MTDITTDNTFEDWQCMARRILNYGTGGVVGRTKEDEVTKEVTLNLHAESKQQGWFFSSCAYGMLWLYESLGVQDPKLHRTKKADNPLNRIAYHEASESVTQSFDPLSLVLGDVVQIGSNGDSHVMAVYDPSAYPNVVFASWGLAHPVDAALIERTVKKKGNAWLIGARPLRRVLRLRSVWEHERRITG